MKTLRKCECGGEAELVHGFGWFYVHCPECGACGKEFAASTKVHGAWPKDAAADAWNDRVMSEEQP